MAKPNILIILADDIGVDAFRIDPQAKIVTAEVKGLTDTAGPVSLPTFSRMLANGVHFAHAWAHPVCTPTRASLWTGTQPWKTGLGYPTGGGDDLPEKTVTEEKVVSLAQALGKGYRCAMFGKWDLGAKKNPVQWGWDYFAGIYRGGVRNDGIDQYGFPPPPPPPPRPSPLASRIGWDRLRNAEGSSKPEKCKAAAKVLSDKYDKTFLAHNPDLRYYIWEKDVVESDGAAKINQPPSARAYPYATEDQVEDAKQWIRAQAGKGPWCVALNLITPHDPFHVPPPGTYQASTITDPAKPTVQDMLVAMLESMDHYVGNLLKAIDDQLANTVIVFVGDNGTQDKDADTGESVDDKLGDDKSTESIGGLHVPMIVADGGLMKGGSPCYVQGASRTIETPAHIIDLYNTVLDIAGVSAKAADSISLTPHLTGSDGAKRTHNFSQMFALPNASSQTPGINASVCDMRYKLTCKLLTNAQTQKPVDRDGKPTDKLVFDYELSRMDPEPDIPGSTIETPIEALRANPDGSFTVSDLRYQSKLLELYDALSKQFLTDKNTTAPVIRAGDILNSTQDITVALRSDSGRFMARCNGCIRGAAYLDNVAVDVEEHELAGSPWAKFKLRKLANGKHALIADTGNCVARCNNCIAGAAKPDSAMIHVPAGQIDTSPWAQLTIKRFTNSTIPNGKYTIRADNGNYLARCHNCAPAVHPDHVFVDVSLAEIGWSPRAWWDIVTLID